LFLSVCVLASLMHWMLHQGFETTDIQLRRLSFK
jgi:hypothetical protein